MPLKCVGATGQGLTGTLSTDGLVGHIRSIQLPDWVGEAIDFTGLDNVDFRCKKPGNIAEPGEVVMEVFLDGTLLGSGGPTMFNDQVLTIVFPITNKGNAIKATLSGSGFIRQVAFGTGSVNEPMVMTITFAFDGETGPAVTPESVGP